MTKKTRFEISDAPLQEELDTYSDRTVFQTPAWLRFVAETQNAEPIVAALRNGNETLGWFTGLIIRKFGFKILGSPFPGWTTSYMGFNLRPDVSGETALRALLPFAFKKLGCIHLEMMDRRLQLTDIESFGCAFRKFRGLEIDITQSEDRLFANMTSACRRCIRKSSRAGITIEEANDPEFADDYYEQLRDVFAKQSLVPTYSIERVRALIKHLLPTGNLLLLRARDQDSRCIATGIFPALNHSMYFWGGASWRNHQPSRPNEAIQWYAMQYWKARGISVYDMGGGGEYKRKYGGQDIAVPWLRVSRYPVLPLIRSAAQRLFSIRQQISGHFQSDGAKGDADRD